MTHAKYEFLKKYFNGRNGNANDLFRLYLIQRLNK